MRKLTVAALESEISAVAKLLAEGDGNDPLGDLSLRERLRELEANLEALSGKDQLHASVALLFYGDPVSGSRGIDAEFAGKAIQNYQAALSKHMVSVAGRRLGARGPVPERKLSRMNITEVVHGSFGFFLEEDNEGNSEMFETALHSAVNDVSSILNDFSDPSNQAFDHAIDQLDSRTFSSIKSLFEILYRENASFKIVDDEQEWSFDSSKIERAYERVEAAEIIEREVTLTGVLIGVIPIARRFEFKEDTLDIIITGTISQTLSADFLERIQNDEQFIGKAWRASFMKRQVIKPGGREREEYSLINLNDRLD